MLEYFMIICYYIAFFGLSAVTFLLLDKIPCIRKFFDMILPIEEE